MVENSNSGLLLKDILSDLSFERELEIITFEDENNLLNHLIKAHENILDGHVHNTILFNLSPPLKNIIRIIKIIKEDPELRVIPTFIFSSSIYEHDLKECYRNQINCYSIKPDESEELISIMEAFEKIWFGYAQLP